MRALEICVLCVLWTSPGWGAERDLLDRASEILAKAESLKFEFTIDEDPSDLDPTDVDHNFVIRDKREIAKFNQLLHSTRWIYVGFKGKDGPPVVGSSNWGVVKVADQSGAVTTISFPTPINVYVVKQGLYRAARSAFWTDLVKFLRRNDPETKDGHHKANGS